MAYSTNILPAPPVKNKNTYIAQVTESVDVISIPPRTGKLGDYSVYYLDTQEDSKFFNINHVPNVLASGKNYILISGTDLLQPTTDVAVEVLDAKGNPLEVEIPNILINGTDRAIVIIIKPDDYYGPATLTVLGEATDVPKKWKGVYNVKWQKIILCNPTIDNQDDAIFKNNPTVTYSEIYDSTGSITKLITDKIIYNQGMIHSKIAGSNISPLMEYQLYLDDGNPVTSNGTFNNLNNWYTGSLYVDLAYVSANKLHISQSYGLFGITMGVTQSFAIKANKFYTLTADFIGTESNLGGGVASAMIYSGSTLLLYLYATGSNDITLTGTFSSSVDASASIELGGQTFAIETVWSNVFVNDLVSGSHGAGFTKDMEGGLLEVSASNMIIYPNTNNYINSTYTTYISKVINSRLAIANNSYQAYNTITKNYDRVPFISGSFSLNYGKPVYMGSDNIKNSYLNISLRNLSTYVGSIKYVDLYKNPGNNYIGRYPIVPHEMLTTGSTFYTGSDFTNSWNFIESGTYTNFAAEEM